jgi:hypothetical protein
MTSFRVYRMDADGHLRHSSFVGLREDKDARGVMQRSKVSYDSEALPGLAVGQ